MKRILAIFACIGLLGVGAAQAQQPRLGEREVLLAQTHESPPAWAVGEWFGHNDYARAEVELHIDGEGRTILYLRHPQETETLRGWYKSGKLELNGDRYLIKQSGRDLELVRESNRDNRVVLRTKSERDELTVSGPRNNDKLAAGNIRFEGDANYRDVEVEIFRGTDRIEDATAHTNAAGRYAVTINLRPGRYQAILHGRERGRNAIDRTVNFEITGMEVTVLRLERPSDRASIRSSTTDFDGVAGTTSVRIEVRRGRDRVYNELIDVRDGRFHAVVSLDRGHYDATIVSLDRGHVVSTKRLSFNVE